MRQAITKVTDRFFHCAGLPIIHRLFVAVLLLTPLAPSLGQEAAPPRARVRAAPGPYYPGQGIELDVRVTGRDQRPRIELPSIEKADIWTIGTSFQPINTTGIGSTISGENLFITQLRVVPRREGLLEIPPIVARLDGRSGRSQRIRLRVESLPLEGRTAQFLGGVGEFNIDAQAMPSTVRVGEDITYRIRVSGPAAWGMTSPPDLSRFEQIALAPRIDLLPDESNNEPPIRTFVYRVRPTRAGEGVLPPVPIAAFDPQLKRYVTKVTRGVSIKALAIPAFDPKTLDYTIPDIEQERDHGISRSLIVPLVLLGFVALGVFIGRLRSKAKRSGPEAARHLARRILRDLEQRPSPGRLYRKGEVPRESDWIDNEVTSGQRVQAARKIAEGLIAYARVGAGRPPGAMTPAEAREVVASVAGSESLGEEAANVMELCDLALFAARPLHHHPTRLLESARGLFSALASGPVDRVDPLSDSRAGENGSMPY
jgi:hypothetical protein